MARKGLLGRIPPFQYHGTPHETSCCCLGLSRKGALPKPSDWESSNVAVLETDRSAVLSLGTKAAALALLRGGVSLPAGKSRTVLCQASCLGQVSQMLYSETDCTENTSVVLQLFLWDPMSHTNPGQREKLICQGHIQRSSELQQDGQHPVSCFLFILYSCRQENPSSTFP